MITKQKIIRIILIIFGSALMGLSIDFFVKANLGLDPLSLFIVGVFGKFGISLGSGSQILMVLILIFLLIVDKKRVGIGSFLNGLSVGAFVKIFAPYMNYFNDSLFNRCIFLLLGFVFMGAGIGMYVSTNLGEAGIDALMMYISEKINKNVNITRVVIDILLSLIGFIFGGSLGIATILSMIVNGYIIQITINIINKIKILE